MPHSESKWWQNVKPCAQTCEMLSLPPRNTVNEPAESLHLVKDVKDASGSHCSLMRFYRDCSGKYPVLDFCWRFQLCWGEEAEAEAAEAAEIPPVGTPQALQAPDAKQAWPSSDHVPRLGKFLVVWEVVGSVHIASPQFGLLMKHMRRCQSPSIGYSRWGRWAERGGREGSPSTWTKGSTWINLDQLGSNWIMVGLGRISWGSSVSTQTQCKTWVCNASVSRSVSWSSEMILTKLVVCQMRQMQRRRLSSRSILSHMFFTLQEGGKHIHPTFGIGGICTVKSGQVHRCACPMCSRISQAEPQKEVEVDDACSAYNEDSWLSWYTYL